MSPYENLPSTAFWRNAVAESSHLSPDGIYQKKWAIHPNWSIGTAGSCFAQHLSRYLEKNLYKVADVEPAPNGLRQTETSGFWVFYVLGTLRQHLHSSTTASARARSCRRTQSRRSGLGKKWEVLRRIAAFGGARGARKPGGGAGSSSLPSVAGQVAVREHRSVYFYLWVVLSMGSQRKRDGFSDCSRHDRG